MNLLNFIDDAMSQIFSRYRVDSISENQGLKMQYIENVYSFASKNIPPDQEILDVLKKMKEKQDSELAEKSGRQDK